MNAIRIDNVREYYDLDPRREWERFERHRLEFPVTLHHLLPHLGPAPLNILDLGGGPGRYALELAKRGHRVTLADLSAANLAFARVRAAETSTALDGCVEADARDLSRWTDGRFDAVLCFGPLYHLSQASDRRLVIAESLRVLRPGGLFACAFISRFAPVFDLLRRDPAGILQRRGHLDRFLETGMHRAEDSGSGFCDAWFSDPDAVLPFLEEFGLERLEFFGAESMIGQSEAILIGQGEAVLQAWIDFACATAGTQAGIMGSEHLVYIGRKPRGVAP